MRSGRALLAVALLAAPPAAPLEGLDDVPGDVARSMVACWHAPHEGDEVTLRLSFRHDGSVFGKPRITYMKASGGADGEVELANSIIRAVTACSPLRFTPSLGAAIAGRIFLIRFVAPRRERRAMLQILKETLPWPKPATL